MSGRKDFTIPVGNSREVVVTITKNGAPWNVTDAAVTATVYAHDGSVLTTLTAANGRIVMGPTPAEGKITVRFDGDDFPAPGVYPYTLDVLPAGEDDPETVLSGSVNIDPVADPGVRKVRDYIGVTMPPTDAEIAQSLAATNSVTETVLSYLRARRAHLIANPLKVSLDGDYTEDWSQNVKYLDALIEQVAKDTIDTDPNAPAAPNAFGAMQMTRPDLARFPRSHGRR